MGEVAAIVAEVVENEEVPVEDEGIFFNLNLKKHFIKFLSSTKTTHNSLHHYPNEKILPVREVSVHSSQVPVRVYCMESDI